MASKSKKAQAPQAKKEPEPVGRPTQYEKKFCDMLLEHCKKGLSFESFAADIDTHRDTLYEWCRQHREFSDARKKGNELKKKYWETYGHMTARGQLKGANVIMGIFCMKAIGGLSEHGAEGPDGVEGLDFE